MRVLLAQLNPTIGDLSGNTEKILEAIKKGQKEKVDIVLFSEMCLTGYPPEDFLQLPHFIEATQTFLQKVIDSTENIIVIIGLPRFNTSGEEKSLFNSAAIIQNKFLLGYQDKSLLPNYDVFSERRYFEPATTSKIWNLNEKRVAITICEDIWKHSDLLKETAYRHDPIMALKDTHPDVMLNLSASPYSFTKLKNRIKVCSSAAKTLQCPLLYCTQVGANDSLLFEGYSLCVDAKGDLLAHAKGFKEDYLIIDLDKKTTPCFLEPDPLEDLYSALVMGVRDYFHKSGFSKACLGLSGGIDSALVACIAAEALGAHNVLGVGMPSRFSSEGSILDAKKLAANLNIAYTEISIEAPFQNYLDLLSPQFENKPLDTTEENLQARIRGMILMAISNKLGHIVLSTGNKSEMALGYSTLYGDMCGGISVIGDVSKTQVYALANWINRKSEIIPNNSITKPPSAELRLNQKDSDSLPDYEIVDHVLEAYVEDHLSPELIVKKFGYDLDLVNLLVKKIHKNEYKRRQAPPVFRITEKAFSNGRRFPIVQKWV
jgi:NAD+ synthase (glutamine-hydrolysing)